MARYRIVVDLDLCQGHGVCQANAPALFGVIEPAGIPYPQVQVLQLIIGDDQLADARSAADFCPNRVIRIEPVEE